MTKHHNDKASASQTRSDNYIVLYGLDENEKPRAARFIDTVNRELLRKAAASLDLELYAATSPELAEIARKLPPGRLYSSGRGFVPNVRRALYDTLMDLIPAGGSDLNSARATAGKENGITGAAIPKNEAGTEGNSAGAPGLPKSWKDIAANHMVLVQQSLSDGWCEAIVVERQGDVLTVRWRDYPKYRPFRVHVDAVALLNPSPSFSE